ELKRALVELRAVTAREPEYADAHGELAIVLLELGRHEEAASTAADAARLDPGRARWHLVRSRALVRSGDPKGGLTAARKAVQLDPANGWAHAAAAEAAWRAERWDEVEQ